MAPPENPNPSTYHLCLLLLLSTATLCAAVSTSYPSLCSSPSHASDRHTDVDETRKLIRSFRLSTGYFSGGGDSLFSPDDDSFNPRSFFFVPHGVSLTTDPTLFHLTATLTLSGPRNTTYQGRGRRRRYHYAITQSVSFVLDGYYSSTSLELCMVGTGTELAADGSMKHYADVALRLRIPRPSSLTDPFVTGSLNGTDFETMSLVTYAEGDSYKYSESVSCPPAPMQPAAAARGGPQALGANFSCAHLKEQLISSYRLKHGSAHASTTSPLLRQHESHMHINQMQCTADGAVRAYVVFTNDTERRWHYQRHQFSVKEEAVVADGHWDSAQSMLCLRACRVARSGPSLAVHECNIGMGFWFPAVWTIQDRSVVAGMLWDSRQLTGNNDAGLISGVISASSIDVDNYRSNLSDVKYDYTMVEEAKKHYFNSVLSSNKKKKIKGSFPGNYTLHDFELHYFMDRDPGRGDAYPVTIGSALVYGDKLAADDSFSRDAVVDMKDELLNVSYDIRHHVAPANWQRPNNGSYAVALEECQITAEGVYDPKTGILCMIGCRELNNSTDCQILITVHFASLDAKAHGHGRGVISSLRDNKTDPGLFFEKIGITLYGMYTGQESEAISRMDLESIMLVISTTLSCVFTVLQILHTKRNHEAPPATSITMLVVLALGYVAPLVLNFEALFTSRRKQYVPFSRNGWLELNEVMLRAPTLVALVLQLRLLQLAWSGRRSADRSTSETLSAAERKALRICLPLYLLGGVLAGIVHVINVRAAGESPLVVRIAPEPATLWEDLVSYAGLILDGFLFPQVILNAFSGSRARAISPWFYVGCTMIRAVPHAYDVVRARNYVPSLSPSYMYASPRGDLFGVAWDVAIPCGAALLALLLFLQQRLGGALLLGPRRRSGEYQMVSSL